MGLSEAEPEPSVEDGPLRALSEERHRGCRLSRLGRRQLPAFAKLKVVGWQGSRQGPKKPLRGHFL